MNEKKWTQGEWSIPHFACPETDCQCGYVLVNHYLGAICTVHCSGDGDWRVTGDNPGFEEAVANAHLIAAAPDLYEALEQLFASFKQLADSGDAGNWSLEDQEEGRVALAALAKARGERHG